MNYLKSKTEGYRDFNSATSAPQTNAVPKAMKKENTAGKKNLCLDEEKLFLPEPLQQCQHFLLFLLGHGNEDKPFARLAVNDY